MLGEALHPEPNERGRPEDDRAIILGLHRGEPATLDLLLDRFWTPLVTYAASLLQGWDEAEDIVQETFVRLWERREAWGINGSVQALLFQITRNLALDEGRRRRRHLTLLKGRDLAPRRSATPAAELEGSQLQMAYEAALAALPDRRREAFLLSRQHGLSYQQIAAVMEISPQTVANQMSAALADLRCSLEPFLDDS
jgi:RNA polymerase sigma-70 factor (ECF subfamily)